MKENTQSPNISLSAQYIKDFSFENPFAPSSLTSMNIEPKVALSLDSKINPMDSRDLFEVEIHINVEVKRKKSEEENDEMIMFRLELVYAGIFSLTNFEEEQKIIVLHTYCPALLFPYVRKIVSDVTQDGGFQPLLMDPIDFGALYHKKLIEKSEKNSSNND